MATIGMATIFMTPGYTLTVRRKSHVQYATTEFPVG